MTLIKKIIVGWLGLCVIAALWAMATGNTSKEAALRNELADMCEDAFDENEGLLEDKFLEMGTKAKLKLKIEYDDNIAPNIETKRGMNRELFVSCQQKLVSNYDELEPWAIIVVKTSNGDTSYELTELDIYDNKEQVWWSEL